MNEKEIMKEQAEREVLDCFLSITGRSDQEIQKHIRPDYIIINSNNEKVGIEITRFTTGDQEVIDKIIKNNHKPPKDQLTVKQEALNRYGSKANRYDYYKICKTLAIGSPIIDIKQLKKRYAKAIEKKYKKYEAILDRFSQFIILCDARTDIGVLNDYDAKETVDNMDFSIFKKSFQVAILYENNGSIFCYQRKIEV